MKKLLFFWAFLLTLPLYGQVRYDTTGFTIQSGLRGGVVRTMGDGSGAVFIDTCLTCFGSGTVTSVALSGTNGIAVLSGSPVTTSGTIALGITNLSVMDTSLAANSVTTAKILNSNVTLAKLANIADQTILGNNSGGAAAPIALTATQTKTILSLTNVENTALSTWAGTSSVVTVGPLTSGSTAAGFTINVGVSTVSGQLPYANGGEQGSAATPATTGAMSVSMTTAIITSTPTGNCTYNATGGLSGQTATFVVTTSGVSSFNLTFGGNFKSTGILATGTTSGKVFTVTFVCNGATWCETGRTTAM